MIQQTCFYALSPASLKIGIQVKQYINKTIHTCKIVRIVRVDIYFNDNMETLSNASGLDI